MNFLFLVSSIFTPSFIKKKELLKLFHLTASVLGEAVPQTKGLSFEECLTEFARFTESEVEKMKLNNRNQQDIQNRLYAGACELGKNYKRLFDVSTDADVIKSCGLLYRILGIDFRATKEGKVTISKCFFSQYYSPETCRIISYLDAGLIAGLSDGGILKFSGRITEGSQTCNAQIQFKKSLS